MKTIFVSGTCRVTTLIYDGRGKIDPIHSQRINDAPNINYLGSFTNPKGHIQFIKFLQEKIKLPEEIQKLRFPYMTLPLLGGEQHTVPQRIDIIRSLLPKCDIFLFEICSTKNYKIDYYGLDNEITIDDCLKSDNKTIYSKSSFEELYNDIDILCNLLPKGTEIIFQTHFRIDVIRDDPNNYIENRDLIYKVVKKYCEDHPEVKHFDPTYLLRENRDYMQDNEHFVIAKLGFIFEHLYVNYIAS